MLLYLPPYTIPAQYGQYLSIAVLAGLDAVVGGTRAIQENSFKAVVFVSGFILTVIIAVALTMFGESLNSPIWYACTFVFTWRILTNTSVIRRNWLEKENIQMPQMPHMPKHHAAHSSDQTAQQPASTEGK